MNECVELLFGARWLYHYASVEVPRISLRHVIVNLLLESAPIYRLMLQHSPICDGALSF